MQDWYLARDFLLRPIILPEYLQDTFANDRFLTRTIEKIEYLELPTVCTNDLIEIFNSDVSEVNIDMYQKIIEDILYDNAIEFNDKRNEILDEWSKISYKNNFYMIYLDLNEYNITSYNLNSLELANRF